jgi:tetratricopeptide (TPR) repeat protein
MMARFNIAVLGLLALVTPFIYLPTTFDFTLHPRLLIIQSGLLICFVVGAILKTSVHIPKTIGLSLAAWLIWTVLSAFWATNPIEALIQINRLITFVGIAFIILTITSTQSFRALYLCAGIAGLLISLIGISQYFGWAFNTVPTVGNPSATFGYRNFAASYVVLLIPCAIAFYLSEKKMVFRLFWASTTVCLILFLIYTRTRGAWLGLAAAFILATMIYLKARPQFQVPKSIQWYFLIPIISLIIWAAFIPAHMQQSGKFTFDERKTDAITTLTTAFSPSDARGRLIVWQHTLEMVRDHWLMGVGLGSWQYIYPKYDQGDWITHNAAPQRPHNDFIWILSETGIIGLILYIWFLSTLGQTLWQQIKRHPTKVETLWMFGITIGLVALAGHSFFSFPRERPAVMFLFWLGVGSIGALGRSDLMPPKPIRSRAIFLASLPLLLCGLTLTYSHLNFDKDYLKAQQAWRKQDWESLKAHTQAALEWGMLNYRILLLKGVAHYQLHEMDQAISTFHTLHTYHPNEGHATLGRVYQDQKAYAPALQHFRIERALYPHSPIAIQDLADALLNWGTEQQQQNHIMDAQSAYLEAQALAPKDARIYNNLGSIYASQNDLSNAENAYKKALALNPQYTRVYHNLGDIYTTKKDTVQAITAYQRFIKNWTGDARYIEIARRKITRLKP